MIQESNANHRNTLYKHWDVFHEVTHSQNIGRRVAALISGTRPDKLTGLDKVTKKRVGKLTARFIAETRDDLPDLDQMTFIYFDKLMGDLDAKHDHT